MVAERTIRRAPASTVDDADIVQFERLGAAWWDEAGPMAALHKLNPTRIGWMRDTIEAHFGPNIGADAPDATLPLSGLRVLDIGCGGGLLSEPLTRLGATVTGIDPAPGNVTAAAAHAAELGLSIDYRATTVEAIAAGEERFDVVIASEVVEHVTDQPRFIATACGLVKPGGLFLASTLNRTAKSFLLAILGAEYILRWLPRGTHRWDRFVRPEDMAQWVRRAGLRPQEPRGLIYDPLRDRWRVGRDTDVNYVFAAARPTPAA